MRRESGWSSSYWTSAVVAEVEPFSGPRRSMAITDRPASASASAISAPLMPMPTTSTSQRASRANRAAGTRGAR